jgi:hypothetical protein
MDAMRLGTCTTYAPSGGGRGRRNLLLPRYRREGCGRTSNGKDDTEERTKIEDQEASAAGLHGDHSGFSPSERKPTNREAKDQRDESKQTQTRSGDVTDKTNRAPVYELKNSNTMDCGGVAEDMPDTICADAYTETFRRRWRSYVVEGRAGPQGGRAGVGYWAGRESTPPVGARPFLGG